ncbi:50S ribosomal protein L9 [Mycoplasma crocodyli]|uniref:Large ribosomal subunit protein bL9 n=1 Tax=Mycoplasma crocodyli (strain ATCC 51981 / MP145) TaxID=512564 RepID=D5E5M5_MYCCM|nr:50S ribosomal protein L9 [Mycoplasma crocodyli]ADE19355.1 50S ribosomal protein L9 [Mycoplasma crocodyli MP145]
MKIILLKDCKEGKANTIVEVSDGYAKNFMIPKGFALAYNANTVKILEKKLDDLSAQEHENRTKALKLKDEIEKVTLNYTLDANIDANQNLNVHGSVSTKVIEADLSKLGYKLDKYSLEKIHFVSEGTHEVSVKLYKDILAKVIVKITLKYVK